MVYSESCKRCNDTGWEGECDCDPDRQYHCKGLGTCGTHECICQRPHIDKEGRFQSDKYPTTPSDCVPLKVTDPTAQDLLWEYAGRRRSVDVEFCDDLRRRLLDVGYQPPVVDFE